MNALPNCRSKSVSRWNSHKRARTLTDLTDLLMYNARNDQPFTAWGSSSSGGFSWDLRSKRL